MSRSYPCLKMIVSLHIYFIGVCVLGIGGCLFLAVTQALGSRVDGPVDALLSLACAVGFVLIALTSMVISECIRLVLNAALDIDHGVNP